MTTPSGALTLRLCCRGHPLRQCAAAELRPPLADLPGDDVVALPVVGALPAAEPLVLRAGASGIKRTGEWSVPARMRVKSGMGSVVLDFCETAIAHPVVEIELVLGTGSAKLLVPDDATANVDALVATMGSVRSIVASQPRAGGPAFRRARARVVGLSHRATAPRDRRAAVLGALAAHSAP